MPDRITTDEVTPEDRRNMRLATLSACWGALPQVMVKDSGIIIIFASLIGASEMVSVMSTGLQDLTLCLLMLPWAALSDRLGVQRQICLTVYMGCLALLVCACAPWMDRWASSVLLGALATFAVVISGYTAAWFPLLDRVVPPAERGFFFGRMRFAWQTTATLFILGSGWFIGRYATVGRLQTIIVLAAIASLGRAFFVSRIVLKPIERPAPMRLGAAIRDAVANRSLIGFGVYLFFLYLAANAAIPVVIVFSKNYLRLADSLVVMLSAVAMCGLIVGFLIGGFLVQRYGVKMLLLSAHIGFAVLNVCLLTVHSSSTASVFKLGAILAAYGILFASSSIAVSSELLALASPANKAVSIALGYSLYAAGLGGSRALASLILGSGILAEQWQIGTIVFTRYHSLFLANAVGVALAMALLVFVPAVNRRVGRLPAL